MALAWVALRSHRSSVSRATNWAATNRIFEDSCIDCLRRKRRDVDVSGRKVMTASAPRAPFLVPPKETTSTPAACPNAPKSSPRAAAALAIRAPSRWTSMSWAWAHSLSAASSSRVYTVPSSVLWVTDTTRACTWCSSPTPWTLVAASSGVSFPSGVGTVSSLEPRSRSGAPHSSTLMWAESAQTMASNGRSRDCRPTTLVPVPLKQK